MLLLKFCKQKAIQQNGITQLERTISTTIFCNQTLDKKNKDYNCQASPCFFKGSRY